MNICLCQIFIANVAPFPHTHIVSVENNMNNENKKEEKYYIIETIETG